MILRRFTDALRQQNWTAIAIEFVLLVLGVFLGMQVSNWNDNRATASRGENFTERLRSDLREEDWGYEQLLGYYGDVAANGRRALDALTGRAPMSDEALLIAAYRATQFSANVRRRATYDELLSRGELGLIGDPALRDLAQRFYNNPSIENLVEEGRNSRYRQWFRLHMPHEVQQAVSQACGDRIVEVGDYAGIDKMIDYPCMTGLPAGSIADAAALLREDPDAIQLLRLRVTDVASNLGNMVVVFASTRDRLRAVAGRAP